MLFISMLFIYPYCLGVRPRQWMPFRPPFATAGKRLVNNKMSCRIKLIICYFINLYKTPPNRPRPTPSDGRSCGSSDAVFKKMSWAVIQFERKSRRSALDMDIFSFFFLSNSLSNTTADTFFKVWGWLAYNKIQVRKIYGSVGQWC